MAPRQYVMNRRAGASEATRQRVIEAAVALHGERGAAATRWTDIAERADVALGTVYRYFPGYDELIPACTGHGLSTLRPPTPEIVGRGTTGAGRVGAAFSSPAGRGHDAELDRLFQLGGPSRSGRADRGSGDARDGDLG